VTGRELLEQLRVLNHDCRQALEEENFRKFRALMQLKKELLRFLQQVPFELEDIELVKEALRQEEALASLAIAKRNRLQAKLKQGLVH